MADPKLLIRVAANLEEFRQNILEAKNQIETTTAAMTTLASSLSGDKLIQNANNIVAAVNAIGGATKLTEAEKARLNATLQRALEKYQALGRDAPAAMVSLEAATRKTAQPLSQTDQLLGKIWSGIKSAAGLIGITFSVQALVSFAGQVFDLAGQINDMSKKLGISAEATQRFKFAAEQTGASLDDIGRSITFMNKALAGGDKSAIAALNTIGLNFQAIRAMKPEAAFEAIVEAVSQIEDPMEQARLATELFGKAGVELLPAIKEGFVAIGKSADVMSDDTIAALDDAGDAWAKFGNQITIITGSALGSLIRSTDQVSSSWKEFAVFLMNAARVGSGTALALADLQSRTSASAKTQKDANKAVVAAKDAYAELQKGINTNIVAAMAPLSQFQKTVILQAIEWGKSTADIAKELGLSELAIKRVVDENKKHVDAAEKAKDAVEKQTKAIRDYRDELSGAKVLGDLAKLEAAWRGVVALGEPSAAAIERTVLAYEKLRAAGAPAVVTFEKLGDAYRTITPNIVPFLENQKLSNNLISEAQVAAIAYIAQIKGTTDALYAQAPALAQAQDETEAFKDATQLAREKTEDWSVALRN